MILLIGGAGFIGSHMAKQLREAGEEFVVFDNLERGHAAALVGAQFLAGDLRNPVDVQRAFREFPITLVMHFAAYIEVGESVQEPSKFYWNNVVGVLVLLDAMRQAGVDQIVFSSTAAVYGEPQYVPLDERHPTNPTSPYGDTKLTVERMLRSYGDAYGLRSVCLRYFNAAGADPDGALGEDHRPETHLIPRLLRAAQGRAEFRIFGEDYDTPDGTCIRDYVHVADLASAHLLALRHLRAGGASDVFNLGTSTGYSVREVVAAAERVVGHPITVGRGPRRAGDPARLVADSTKIRQALGWAPKHADLDTIVGHAWNWFQANPDGYASVVR